MTVATCRNGDVEIAYETFGHSNVRPLLLVMGMGTSMLLWHEDFCAALVERGFYVARFDNRDAGRSTHLGERVDQQRRSRSSRASAARYTLADMAADAVAVLDALRWPGAHVVGVSLGGMIGQVMAVHHADRVRSLTSISSAPCNRWRVSRPKISTLVKLAAMARRAGTGRDAAADNLVTLFRIIGSPAYAQDKDWLRQVGMRDHGLDPAVIQRQMAALRASGDRRAELSRVQASTLVLHGEADPLQSVRAGKATAEAIPAARLVTYPGMGHDLPRALWSTIIDEISAVATRADAINPINEAQ